MSNDDNNDKNESWMNKNLEMESIIWIANVMNNNNNNNNMNHNQNDEHCLEVNWDETIRYISDPIFGMEEGLRSWLWQTCTEFGFYQTCEFNTSCPFAQGYHALSQDIEICIKAFNISSGSAISDMIQETNIWSGGWKLRTSGITNIVSITGTIDPWSELALQQIDLDNNSTTMPIYHVKGASHHFWTHPIQSTDGPEIDAARQYIYRMVRQMVGLPGATNSVVGEYTAIQSQ
jgi:thymus-specific serine protease